MNHDNEKWLMNIIGDLSYWVTKTCEVVLSFRKEERKHYRALYDYMQKLESKLENIDEKISGEYAAFPSQKLMKVAENNEEVM